MSIKVGFIVPNPEHINTVSSTLTAATLNQSILGNTSVILAKEPVIINDQNRDLFTQLEKFPLFKFQTKVQLESLVFSYNVRVCYMLCDVPDEAVPSAVPLCVHGAETTPPFGNVFCTTKEVPLFTPDINSPENIDNIRLFDQKFIQQTYSNFPTVGFKASGLTTILVGSKITENIPVFNMPSSSCITPPIPKEQPPPVDAPMQNLRATMARLRTPQQSGSVKRIKLLCNWVSSEQLAKDWEKMSKGGKWTIQDSFGIEVVQDNPDYYIIINKPPQNEHYDPAKTIVFRMEPYIDQNSFFNTWLYTQDWSKFMYFLNHESFRNNTEWWLSSTPETLIKPIEKTAILSTVISSQYAMKGHRLRVDFVKYFQENSKLQMDVYGNDNKFNLINYKGSLPLRQKDAGIFPYKYHFAAENSCINNYFTEKFHDSILGECLLFYWGCGNVEEHIDPRAFIRLDLEDKEKSMKTIEEAIANNEWEKRIDVIRREKNKIIYSFNFFPRVCSLLYADEINYVWIAGPDNIQIPGVKASSVPSTTQLPADQIQSLLCNFISSTVQLSQLARLVDHLMQWRFCAQSDRVRCVLESQVKTNFLDHLTSALAIAPPDWDIIFLSWNPPNHQTEVVSRTALTPFWIHAVGNISIIGDKRVMSSGDAGNGYLLHPRGARKLLDVVERYGFFSPLDEMFLVFHSIIPSLKSFVPYKNLIETIRKPETENFHIFHTNAAGMTNAPPKFTYPPAESRKQMMLISDGELKKRMNDGGGILNPAASSTLRPV